MRTRTIAQRQKVQGAMGAPGAPHPAPAMREYRRRPGASPSPGLPARPTALESPIVHLGLGPSLAEDVR